jgi:diguanylate cyclase (GGDEF)-like protein
MNVLIIDDDDETREIIRIVLGARGISVVEAVGGREGVRLAAAEKPDAVLLDVQMPALDGPATLALLREDPATAGIPVFFLTASSLPAERARLEGLGAAGVIGKPFDLDRLESVLRARSGPGGRPSAAPSAAAPVDEMERLRKRFVERSAARLQSAREALGRLAADAANQDALRGLMRIFHGFAGLGTSFGFADVTALGKEGELGCLAFVHAGSAPGPDDLADWSRTIDAISYALEAPAGAVPAAASTHEPPLHEVLVVDGDPAAREELRAALAQEGLAMWGAATRAEALQRFVEARPDAVIADVVLPDGSGYELVESLRVLPGAESLPIVVCSQKAGFLDKVEAIHCGADAYFEKPVDWKALMRRLQHLLGLATPRPVRVLSVEDDPDHADLVRSVLESGGHEVRVLRDPRDLEETLLEFTPDLLLMDIVLPGTSGHDVVRFLRQDERFLALPVLFLTTEGQLQARFRSAEVGGDEHLVKPVPAPLLLATVAARAERARFLRGLMERDGLTRLLTHTAFAERARAAHAQKARDPDREFAWVMIDVDHFKKVNDRYGHPVGDRVLSSLSAHLRRRLRQSDTIGRYGGEEFVVLLEGLPREEALRLVDRVREGFSTIEHALGDGSSFRCTFSAGIAMLGRGTEVEDWKQAADEALYAAKAAGRNNVVAVTAGRDRA